MKTAIKVLVGIVLVVAAVGLLRLAIGNATLEERDYTALNPVASIRVEDLNAEVTLLRTQESRLRMQYQESRTGFYEITEQEGQLRVIRKDRGHLFGRLFYFEAPGRTLTIHLPQGMVDLDLTTSNGRVTMEDGGSFENLRAHTSNGDMSLSAASVTGELTMRSSNGSVRLNGVEVTGAATLTSSNGAIEIVFTQ